MRCGWVRFGSVRFGSVRCGWVRFGSVRCGFEIKQNKTVTGPVFPFGFEMGFFAVESEGAKLNDPGELNMSMSMNTNRNRNLDPFFSIDRPPLACQLPTPYGSVVNVFILLLFLGAF